MKDQNENDFVEADDSSDVSNSRNIKAIKIFPKPILSTTINDLYGHNVWKCSDMKNKKRDCYIIFDVGPIKIDSFHIQFDGEFPASTVKVYIDGEEKVDDGDGDGGKPMKPRKSMIDGGYDEIEEVMKPQFSKPDFSKFEKWKKIGISNNAIRSKMAPYEIDEYWMCVFLDEPLPKIKKKIKWKLFTIKRNIKKESINVIFLKSQNTKYVKLSFCDKLTNTVGIRMFKWMGYESKIKKDVTSKIKVYQTSNQQHDEDPNEILKQNKTSWKGAGFSKSWIIFDCMRYEIDKIKIEFAEKCKPEIVKLRCSEVGNAYSFKKPSIQKWKLKTSQKGGYGMDNEWKTIKLTEELTISPVLYKNGFKRYLQLEFSKYMASHMEVVFVRFYGKKYENIPNDSEQFDPVLDADVDDSDNDTDDEKKDDNEQYKPIVIDHTPPYIGKPERIFMDENPAHAKGKISSVAFKSKFAFITVDLGNNIVDKIIIKPDTSYTCKKCIISTTDKRKPKSNDWTVLHEDNEFDDTSKWHKATYIISGSNKKYIKLEFSEPTDNKDTVGVERIKFIGDSEYLEKENELTIDDIKNMASIDEELILRFQKQEQKRINTLGSILRSKYTKIGDDKDKSLDDRYGNEYIESMNEYEINLIEGGQCLKTKFLAYKQSTVFEQEQMMKIAELQKNIAMKFVKPICKELATYNRFKEEVEPKLEEAKEVYEQAMKDKVDTEKIIKLKQDVDSLENEKKNLTNKHFDDKDEREAEKKKALTDAVYSDPSKEAIFNVWKESIQKHPRTLSYRYNVMEYQQMIDWALKYKKTEIKQLWTKLADLFDESFLKRTECMHKYHLFQLSSHYPKRTTKDAAVWILFDCGDRKIQRFEFITKYGKINKIEVYTANELREEKNDTKDDDDDDDDICYDWSNFNIICKKTIDPNYEDEEGPEDGQSLKNFKVNAWISDLVKIFGGGDKKKKDEITFEDSKTNINLKNQRYIKIVFLDNRDNAADVEVQQMRFFVQSNDKNERDDDEVEGGPQLNKYKLKMIDASDKVYKYWKGEDINKAYILDEKKYYSSQDHTKTPYITFDCETRKVEKFELRFRCQWKDSIKTMTILTSDTLNDDDQKWTEIFKDENIENFKKKYGENIEIIHVESKNKRYLKFAFILTDESNRYYINHLKFYTIDPPDDYKWDIDEGIKNLTRSIKIVAAYDHSRDSVVENIYDTVTYNNYRPRFVEQEYNYFIELRIRDQVCKGLNNLRGGGTISSQHKHFLKFLLCWQNKAHYDEILDSAKRVMNILSRPLIIEYKKLQSNNSKILTLKLDEKDRLPKQIVSNHGLLEWDYNKWYKYRKAFFYPNDLKPLGDEWIKLGLNLQDTDFKHLRRNDIIDKERSFTSSDELAMEYLNLIAAKLDPSFQNSMKELFKQNRIKLNLKYPTNSGDLGVLSGPIKTKARQNIKVKLDYFDKPSPQCMAVLDIVRCAIVCENDNELCNLYNLIISTYSGKILRIKNAFDDINKGTYGYRAVLMNIAYGDQSKLPKGFQMICEVQLLLYNYYQVRKMMHLGYGICRSEEGGFAHKRQPYYVLAQDSCKFGKLDI